MISYLTNCRQSKSKENSVTFMSYGSLHEIHKKIREKLLVKNEEKL